MSRNEDHQNDISLIIGTLPKRLQRKIAENAEGTTTVTTSRPITILTKSSLSPSSVVDGQEKPKVVNDVVKVPILEASDSGNKPKNRAVTTSVSTSTCIPGILRVKDPAAASAPVVHSGRRRRRQQHNVCKDKEQTPLSPLARVRLTTDHPEWFENLLTMPQDKKIIQLYDQLMVLQQRNLILINWKNFCCLHDQLQDCFKRLLLEQLKFVCEHKVDAFFWKLLFYNVREYLKRQRSDLANTHMLLLMEQSIQFYHVVYDKLMVKYAASSRCESAAKVVGQRLLICLGDLSRYRANHLQTSDYLEASKYYQRAQELVPGNGAPYNQLAVIAIYHHKLFDAVYYYMRSLLTSNSVQTAKESLLDLFDEIRRKYEETEMKQSPMHCASVTPKKATKQMRKEVWIYPDGIRFLHRTNVKPKAKNNATLAEVNRYDEMTTEELLHRILSLYLYLIGKLYTGTNVDCLYLLLRKFQIQLSAALKCDSLLSRSKLLKMVALNVFVMEHNKRSTRREMRYHSFNFANSFFGLILRKVNQLLSGILENSVDLQCLPDENYTHVNTYLQFVRVYVRWLTINVNLWEPVRTEEHAFIDCWVEMQTLFDYIECINGKFPTKFDRIYSGVVLDEDVVLSGFDPLGRETVARECNQRGSERTQFLERIKKIAEFQFVYMENQHALQQPPDSSFTIEDLNAAMQVALNNFDVTDTATSINSCLVEPNETECQDQPNACPSMDADISELCRLKKELEAKAKVQQICSTRLEEILKFVDTKLYIEVRPRYLLPDTNCFIDCLEDIERLSMEYKRYTVVIPLTVVKELDGLSKGVKLDSYRNSKQTKRIHHFDEVSTCAKKSIEFIKSAKNVKCATTKGSFVNASVFGLVEEEYLSNDDKILATAVAVSKTASSEQCKDGKCFIQTELVLITTDRNLRVKALSRNLAVSGLDEFLQWAKDCRETT